MSNPVTDNTPELRDIHLLEPSLWPPAPGWWVLALITLVACAYLVKRINRSIQKKRHTQQLLSLLNTIESDSKTLSDTARLGKLSELLKQLALMRYGAQRVSSLSGNAWLRFLDNTGGDSGFTEGAGQILAQGPYSKHLAQAPDWDALTQLIKRWINHV